MPTIHIPTLQMFVQSILFGLCVGSLALYFMWPPFITNGVRTRRTLLIVAVSTFCAGAIFGWAIKYRF